MTSTFTPNIQLEEPARGDDVGTWDTPVNNNMTLLDLTIGGAATINIGSCNVTLSGAHYKSRMLIFSSTLIGNTTITFPTSFSKDYLIQNVATGSSAFTIICASTLSLSGFVAVPPGDTVQIFNAGGNIGFLNLGRVGEYWDYAGSAVPAWVTASNPVPYLNCD